jgi:hypothetical protein
MKPRAPIWVAVVLSLCFAGASSGLAEAKCPPGQVWDDLGCRPASQPSLLVKAIRHIKSAGLRRKAPAKPAPDTKQQ